MLTKRCKQAIEAARREGVEAPARGPLNLPITVRRMLLLALGPMVRLPCSRLGSTTPSRTSNNPRCGSPSPREPGTPTSQHGHGPTNHGANSCGSQPHSPPVVFSLVSSCCLFSPLVMASATAVLAQKMLWRKRSLKKGLSRIHLLIDSLSNN